MKKRVIILLAVISAVAVLFTACGKKDNNAKDENTTTVPAVTTVPATTERVTDDISVTNAGAPESTNTDSAIGNAIEDAADGAADAAEDIGDAAERVGDRIAQGEENIKNDMQDR